MSVVALSRTSPQGFPKSHRLLKRRDFLFRPYKRFQTENFNFIFTRKGHQRLGISISKKVLRRANARNRIRRLIRETFRLHRPHLEACDVHVVGLGSLTGCWEKLRRQDIEAQFEQFLHEASGDWK